MQNFATTVLAFTVLLTSPVVSQETTEPPPFKPRKVAIVVFENVQLLDFAGPAEVFTDAGRVARKDGQSAFEVFTVATSKKPVHTRGAVTVIPDYDFSDCPQPDILIIPGGGTQSLTQDDKGMAWVRATAEKTEIDFSVCTGAFVLGAVGLLDGIEATTHWRSIDRLRRSHPKTRVLDDRRVVDAGAVITSAGVSAGIDGSLYLVEKLCGKSVADQTARVMEYERRGTGDGRRP